MVWPIGAVLGVLWAMFCSLVRQDIKGSHFRKGNKLRHTLEFGDVRIGLAASGPGVYKVLRSDGFMDRRVAQALKLLQDAGRLNTLAADADRRARLVREAVERGGGCCSSMFASA
ncbi:hypothetical protein NDU88_001298 [Pleurodeles waltl]|uniref:Uncharacterized protein n=1 Tax=Pleurodeles waltl TaxID=8319 RepID=A0AAV7U640_PLEWA|nr:hypothetical protein NDU88_001298 [Pleurodeles waltl]